VIDSDIERWIGAVLLVTLFGGSLFADLRASPSTHDPSEGTGGESYEDGDG
jgi:hypothetical protein